jgi:hypothetical protein
MASCRFCNTSGSNMLQCGSCKQIWCHQCITWHPERVPHYPPKASADNQCPYCGKYDEIRQAP